MPQAPIPEISQEARAQLIMDILQYLDPLDRIWDHVRVTSHVAELVRAIAMGKPANPYASTWVIQILKKMPPLWERVKIYYEWV